jgi:hypothetical protein
MSTLWVSEAMYKIVMHNPKYLSKDGLISARRRIEDAYKSNRQYATPEAIADFKDALSRIRHALAGHALPTKHRLPASELQAKLATVARYNPGYLKA